MTLSVRRSARRAATSYKGALERRRQTLAGWRTQFSSACEENKTRISTLRSQLATLGPVAEDGSDPIEITHRRAELNMKLSVLLVPGLTAQQAYNHADGLIQEIDAMIRTQQTEAVFSGAQPAEPRDVAADIDRDSAIIFAMETGNFACGIR